MGEFGKGSENDFWSNFMVASVNTLLSKLINKSFLEILIGKIHKYSEEFFLIQRIYNLINLI